MGVDLSDHHLEIHFLMFSAIPLAEHQRLKGDIAYRRTYSRKQLKVVGIEQAEQVRRGKVVDKE